MRWPAGRAPAAWSIGAAVLVFAACGCTTLPTGPVQGVAPPVRGITLVDWTSNGYGTATALTSLDALAATGANTVTVLVTAYQADRNAAAVRSGDPRTPTPAAVQQIVSAARARGLRVALKPHVDLDDGSWRGYIAPADAEEWFRSYRSFVLPWADLARSLGADQFVVGTELAGTLGHEPEWRRTIAGIRARFPGELVYAASWDEAAKVPFWDTLDLVGVDFYFPVAHRSDAGRLEILAAWQPWLERLRLLHRQTGRDILFSEIGYRSVDGAGMTPYAFGAGLGGPASRSQTTPRSSSA